MKVKPRVPADLADYVSHELRSPLNGIKVWAQVLVNSLDCNDDSTARRALDGIAECIEKQVQFLDALLAEGDGHSAAAPRSNSDTPEDPMAKSTQPNEQDQDRNRKAEHPQRPDPEPDTMEGPGGRREAKAEEDAKNRTTRRGER
jgi:K+-sensing histidine kinase KdpD